MQQAPHGPRVKRTSRLLLFTLRAAGGESSFRIFRSLLFRSILYRLGTEYASTATIIGFTAGLSTPRSDTSDPCLTLYFVMCYVHRWIAESQLAAKAWHPTVGLPPTGSRRTRARCFCLNGQVRAGMTALRCIRFTDSRHRLRSTGRVTMAGQRKVPVCLPSGPGNSHDRALQVSRYDILRSRSAGRFSLRRRFADKARCVPRLWCSSFR